ncbi:acyl carrier protein [Leisingera thetidis]|uniref:acyl carrier protein n=1 Tax=Leisingera thetidis TaxID=2930199 RepID=UPI0021F720C7|nr:phosphopantetheine-binding protein [Leisingera thetidis]
MTDLLAKIQDVLCQVTGENMDAVTASTDLENDLDLDSILFVQFLLALEDVVPGLEFSQETLAEANFTTIGCLAGFIAENSDGAAAA